MFKLTESSAAAIPPLISIGLPVYNGALDLPELLESLLLQDYGNFEIIIADNASTDATEAICRSFVARDSRVRYIRHGHNMGAPLNFMFVLEQSTAEYFMWVAADDRRSSDYLRLNQAFLENHPDYVGSTSKTRFDGAEYDPLLVGDGLLNSPRKDRRIATFLSLWNANSSFYSLFRRAPLSQSVQPIAWYLAFDWSITLRLAAQHRMARLEEGWCIRGARGLSSNLPAMFASARSRPIHWILPFYDLSLVTLGLLQDVRWKDKFDIIVSLARLNYQACRAQLSIQYRVWQRRWAVRMVFSDR